MKQVKITIAGREEKGYRVSPEGFRHLWKMLHLSTGESHFRGEIDGRLLQACALEVGAELRLYLFHETSEDMLAQTYRLEQILRCLFHLGVEAEKCEDPVVWFCSG